MYQIAIGKPKKIYLIPEWSIIINLGLVKDLSSGDFMRPSKRIQKAYEEAAINKVALLLDDTGYSITGDPIEPLKKVANITATRMNVKQTKTCLMTMGMSDEDSMHAIKVAAGRLTNKEEALVIYGVRDDYISADKYHGLKKTAKIKGLIGQYTKTLKKDLIKEASIISDPEAVDVVLGLNFINEDNVNTYIENIDGLKKLSSDMAELLIASRMGLSDIDENAVSKILDSTDMVIQGLENLKLAVRD